MVKCFSIQDLIAFSKRDAAVKRVLRLDQMAVPGTKAVQLIQILKRGKVRVDGQVAGAIAKIILFLGIDHNSSIEMLCRIVRPSAPYSY